MSMIREDDEFEIICDTCGAPAAPPATSHREAVGDAKAAFYDFIPIAGNGWTHRCRACRLAEQKARFSR